MALITCVECQNKVSDLAKDCPQCGAPVSLSKKTPCFECGNLLGPGINICNSCGVDQALNPDKKIETAQNTESSQAQQEKKPDSEPVEENKKTTETTEKSQAKYEQPKSNVHVEQSLPPVSKPKSGCLKPLLIGGLIVIVLGIVVFNFLPPELKRDLYRALGIENSDFVRDDLASYIHLEETRHKQNWLGTWVIDGMVYNLHESITVNEVDIKVKFSDYDETYTIYRNLRPGKIFQTPFEIRINDGHKGAYFEGCEVVGARE